MHWIFSFFDYFGTLNGVLWSSRVVVVVVVVVVL